MVLVFDFSWIPRPSVIVLVGVKPKSKTNYLVNLPSLKFSHSIQRKLFLRGQSDTGCLYLVLVLGFFALRLLGHGGSPVVAFV